MANMQRLLGTMLASRMAGRGGMGGALGSAAMMGLGGPLLRSKAGLAAMGYLAYRSYRGSQAKTDARPAGAEAPAAPPGAEAEGRPAGAGLGGIGGAIGGLVDQVAGQFTGGGRRDGTEGASLGDRIAAALEGKGPAPAPEETVSERKALLLIRAMIAAANSDGRITDAERERICAQLREAGADEEDKRLVKAELSDPKPLDALLREVTDRETAQQFYLASRVAVDGGTPAQKSYLTYLRQRLDLPEDDVDAVEKLTA
jgi:uncharacterized membrane protein YebE (DUF533 family)